MSGGGGNGSSGTVLVTGGAGYVGSALVPKLLAAGHRVRVLDLYLYGEAPLHPVRGHPRLEELRGDLRDAALVRRAVAGADAVIHLACISNDPSFELDPELGKSINHDAFAPLVAAARDAGVARFIFASSSSVYGVKTEPEVTEDLPLEPLTDYSRYKALCEEILLAARRPGFAALILRPATVCGPSPRLRLDLTVNILTAHARVNRKIRVFGGAQTRPNIHIDDMTDLYLQSLAWETERIDGRIYNAGYGNATVAELAGTVRGLAGEDVAVETLPSDDPRSYRISSERIRRELGFAPRRTVEDAVRGLLDRFDRGLVPGAMTDSVYYNVRRMREAGLR